MKGCRYGRTHVDLAGAPLTGEVGELQGPGQGATLEGWTLVGALRVKEGL